MTSNIVPYNMYEAVSAYQRLQARLPADNPEQAIMEIKTFMKMYPDVALAHNDLGVMYYKLGYKLLALANYEKANRLLPETLAFVKNLAEFYAVELGWLDDAIVMLTDLLKQHPDEVDLLIALGMISERIGRENEARSFYKRALDLDPGNQAVRDAIAALEGPVSATEYRQPAPAQPAPFRPASVQPARPAIPHEEPKQQDSQLGDILARLRSSVSTTQTDTVKPQQAAHNTTELYNEARALVAAGKDEDAISTLERLISIEPGNASACNDLGVLYARRGDEAKSCLYHERAVAINPRELTFRKNLADLYYSSLGRTDEAIAIYTQLVNEYPQDVETLTALAIICEANNLRDQARVFIRKVLDVEPWNSDARNFLVSLG